MTQQSTPNSGITVYADGGFIDRLDVRRVASLLERYLDVATTVTGQATAYNSKSSQQEMLATIHREIMAVDRGLYAAVSLVDGTLDISRQITVQNLLGTPRTSANLSRLAADIEDRAIAHTLSSLKVTRVLKLFEAMAQARINNARTRRLMLGYIMDQPFDVLELWAVRYRQKLRAALTHALGKVGAKQLRRMCEVSCRRLRFPIDDFSGITGHKVEEPGFVGQVPREAQKRLIHLLDNYSDHTMQCIGFILGAETHVTLPLLQAYVAVKRGDFEAGKVLPYETLEGLRSVYHKERKTAEVLEITKKKLTAKQALVLQRAAQKAGVEVKFDPTSLSAVELYVQAFETGTVTPDVSVALIEKAIQAARALPVKCWDSVRVIVDTSESMKGTKTQKWRPIAVACATRDMLTADSDMGRMCPVHLPVCGGPTDLACQLLEVLSQDPEVDVICVITDGYENSPSGRFAEVLKAVRDIGITTPVYQFSPVSGAESAGIRELAPGLASAVPVSDPAAMGTAMLRAVLRESPADGIRAVVERGLTQVGYAWAPKHPSHITN